VTPDPRRFRMPAEWEPHAATWLTWPAEKSDWPGKFAPIPWLYGDIVRHLARVEQVRIVVADDAARRGALRILKKCHVNLDAVEFHLQATDRSWIRDYGPIFVMDRTGEVAMTRWRFNGWAKYDNWRKDARVPETIARRLKYQSWAPDLVLEGGSIDVNGAGKMLTTEECLLSEVQARNPGRTRGDLEQAFATYLGIREVIWLGRGIEGDDTHGHVDDLARFTAPDTVATVVERDKTSGNYEPLRDNLARLRAHRGLDGRGLKVVELPMPEPIHFDKQLLPASYANFYIANGIVLAPVFSDKNDLAALRVLARLFPDREVIPVPCRDLILGLGALHCMTQQQPGMTQQQPAELRTGS
jgi:agmatine deiminase